MQIPERFNGPPTSGNGGWSAGAFAVATGARDDGKPFEVTLRAPPPLVTPLEVIDGRVTDGATLIAEVAAVADAGMASRRPPSPRRGRPRRPIPALWATRS